MSTADDAAYWHACWKRAASERAAAVARAEAAEAKVAAVEAQCARMEETTDMGDYGTGLLAAAEWVRAALATEATL